MRLRDTAFGREGLGSAPESLRSLRSHPRPSAADDAFGLRPKPSQRFQTRSPLAFGERIIYKNRSGLRPRRVVVGSRNRCRVLRTRPAPSAQAAPLLRKAAAAISAATAARYARGYNRELCQFFTSFCAGGRLSACLVGRIQWRLRRHWCGFTAPGKAHPPL